MLSEADVEGNHGNPPVQALWIVGPDLHTHALEKLEGLTAKVSKAHATEVHNPECRAMRQGPAKQDRQCATAMRDYCAAAQLNA